MGTVARTRSRVVAVYTTTLGISASSSVAATMDRCWVDACTYRHLDGSTTPGIAASPEMGATGLPATVGLSATSSVDGTATAGVGATTSGVASTTLPMDACIASSAHWITGDIPCLVLCK
jgi:hypothetical protein